MNSLQQLRNPILRAPLTARRVRARVLQVRTAPACRPRALKRRFWSGTGASILAAPLILLMAEAASPQTQLVLVVDRSFLEPLRVFADGAVKIDTVWRNDATNPARVEMRLRLHQTPSATAALVTERPWKSLQVLPGQTVIESTMLDIPAVKAETRFVVQWLENTNRVLGTTELLAYPSDLMRQLRPLAGDGGVGVFDPQNQIKPLLLATDVESTDLADTGFADFRGKLAILGPFRSKAGMPEDLRSQTKALAQRGVAVVWIQPPPQPHERMKPSFYSVPIGKGTVVVAQSKLFAGLENHRCRTSIVWHVSDVADE